MKRRREGGEPAQPYFLKCSPPGPFLTWLDGKVTLRARGRPPRRPGIRPAAAWPGTRPATRHAGEAKPRGWRNEAARSPVSDGVV